MMRGVLLFTISALVLLLSTASLAEVTVSHFPDKAVVGSTKVSFTGTYSGTGFVVGSTWNFGDGAKDSTPSSSHVYKSAGVYTVSLTLALREGTSETGYGFVEVCGAPGVVVSAASSVLRVGREGSFSASLDSGDLESPDFVWDFGDGSSGSGSDVSHKYGASGTYKVGVVVSGSIRTGGSVVSVSSKSSSLVVKVYGDTVYVDSSNRGVLKDGTSAKTGFLALREGLGAAFALGVRRVEVSSGPQTVPTGGWVVPLGVSVVGSKTAVVLGSSGVGHVFTLLSGTSLSGFNIPGAPSSGGILVSDSSSVSVLDCVVGSSGVVSGKVPSVEVVRSGQVSIERCSILGGGVGISLDSCKAVSVVKGSLSGCGGCSFLVKDSYEVSLESCSAMNGRGTGCSVSFAGSGTGEYSVDMNKCVFSGNKSARFGGVLVAGLSEKPVKLSFCTVSSNVSSGDAGAIGVDSGNVRVSNCLVFLNSCAGKGEGVWFSGGSLLVSNSTVVGSGTLSTKKSGVVWASSLGLVFKDSILYDSSTPPVVVSSPSLWPTVDHCCVFKQVISGSVQSLVVDPLFVDLSGKNFHLKSGSPCFSAASDGKGMGVTW